MMSWRPRAQFPEGGHEQFEPTMLMEGAGGRSELPCWAGHEALMGDLDPRGLAGPKTSQSSFERMWDTWI